MGSICQECVGSVPDRYAARHALPMRSFAMKKQGQWWLMTSFVSAVIFVWRPASEWVTWLEATEISEDAIGRIFPESDYFNVGRLAKYGEDWMLLSNSLGVGCGRARLLLGASGAKTYADLFITATASVAGRETSIAELRVWGERAVNLYKILNPYYMADLFSVPILVIAVVDDRASFNS